MTELHPSVYQIAPSVAYGVWRRYKAYVEREDVLQECYSWAITRNKWITEELNEEDPKKRQHNESRVAWQMLRNAQRYARREKATKSGYSLVDEVYYETFTLAQLLPFVIASVLDGTVLEQAQEMLRDGQPKGSSSPAEGGNLLASLIDIKKAFNALEDYDKQVLIYRYHEALTLAQIAEIYQCAVSTADRKCMTSLRRLQNKLGGDTPFR
jgi:RNA polymerase sigma factor (sigma-70 family)